ncbi:MAG TPA: Slp family lipoprotein [Nitrospira sp.]|nr:Slp family lipoprotein [Nitrospira sp.]
MLDKSSSLAVILAILSFGCSYDVFPERFTKDLDHTFDFATWRSIADHLPATKVELGGRLIEAQTLQGKTTIVVQQLPIVKHPAYGPKLGKTKGEFVIDHRGPVNPGFLSQGNRIMVVGTTRGMSRVVVDDIVRALPTIEAACIHIWKTGDTEIADYSSAGAGYAVLEEETFCVS